MNPLFHGALTGVLALHGVIHLLGVAAYLKLAEVQTLPYKTTVLDGRWDLGPTGIALFGVLWGVAALGFLYAALAFGLRWESARATLLGVALLSLVLTILDFRVAPMGIGVNLAILLLIVLLPRLSSGTLQVS